MTHGIGYRRRLWETRVGEVPLWIPKPLEGAYFRCLLEQRIHSEQVPLVEIQEAYVKGVRTRKFDDLVQAMGLIGVDKSKVSCIYKNLDEQVQDFRHRPLEDQDPYVWRDALYLKVRQKYRVVSLAVVDAVGVTHEGECTMCFDVGASEEETFWHESLRSLVE